MLRQFVRFIAAALAFGACGDQAQPQTGFPVKPVRIVIPYPAGGPVDAAGRQIAKGMQEMLKQLLDARQDAQVKLSIGTPGTYLRRYQDMVYLDQEQPAEPFALTWHGEETLRLPDGSCLRFVRGVATGLAYERLGIDRLRIAQRTGGERFKPDLARPSRTLKHLLQEAHMPPWQRQRLPLVYHEGKLALVPGIGVSAELQAREHEPALDIIWQPAGAWDLSLLTE